MSEKTKLKCSYNEGDCCPTCCDHVKSEIEALKQRYSSLQVEIKQLKAETLQETTNIVDVKVQGMKDYFQQMILDLMKQQ